MANQKENLRNGERYWTVYHNAKTQYFQILEATWNGDIIDLKRQREKRLFSLNL